MINVIGVISPKQKEFQRYIGSKLWDKANHLLQHEYESINLSEYFEPDARHLQSIIINAYSEYLQDINDWNIRFDTFDYRDVENYSLEERRETFDYTDNPLVLFIKLLIPKGLNLNVKMENGFTALQNLHHLSPGLHKKIDSWFRDGLAGPYHFSYEQRRQLYAFCAVNNRNHSSAQTQPCAQPPKEQWYMPIYQSLGSCIGGGRLEESKLPFLTDELCKIVAEFLTGTRKFERPKLKSRA